MKGKGFIIIGIIFIIIGLLFPYIKRLKLGRLPGDIIIKGKNFTFYFPLTTGLLISIVLSIIIWLVNRYGNL